MKRHYEPIYKSYFNIVYALVYRYYPKDADTVTAEVFKHRIFEAVDSGFFEGNHNYMAFVIYESINYCAMKRFGEIYCRYSNIVYAIAYRHHPNHAEDVTAEIFEKKILKAIYKGRFEEDKDYTPLIVRIAINQCYSIYKRNKRHRSDSLDDQLDLEYSKAGFLPPEILNPYVPIDTMIDFERALEFLTRKQCLVMLMTVQGYTDMEIAMVLNTTVHAVRMLRRRAREKLRRIMR